MLELYAGELDLAVPTLPWHTNRTRVAELGAALAIAAGVGREDRARRRCCSRRPRSARWPRAGAGGSSTMPQKRNPVGATLARASPGSPRRTRRADRRRSSRSTSGRPAPGRPSGRRSPERSRTRAARSHALAGALESLEVDPGRMRANLDLTGGLVLAERVAFLLMDRLGRAEAQAIVREAALSRRRRRASATRSWPTRAPASTPPSSTPLLDPATYLGAAAALVDRALARSTPRAGA